MKTDATAIATVVDVFSRMRCPDISQGEGSPAFPTEAQGEGTPDLVAGPFHGRSDPKTFYIDVWSPTGDYFVDASAGAPLTATAVRQLFSMKAKNVAVNRDLPLDYARELLRAVSKKSTKYSSRRGGSPLFGAVACFLNTRRAKDLFAAMLLPRALHEELGPVPYEMLLGHFLANREHGVNTACVDVSWDIPIAFLAQIHRGRNYATVTLFRNNHERLAAYADHPILKWLDELVEEAKAQPRPGPSGARR